VVIEVAEILRAHASRCRSWWSDAQQRVVRNLVRCRTAALGGQVWQCDRCGQRRYSYHSCRDRHCPKCHGEQTARWLQKQRARLLPCDYYLLTFTLPGELRPLARAHSQMLYGLLMSSAFAALAKLARDPRYVGGQIGALAVLHTWTRAMLYHPHVHLLVPAGGLHRDGQQWVAAKNPAYLVPVRALSLIYRAKLRDRLHKAGWLGRVPAAVWSKTKPWVVHCQHAGRGQKVIEYLARYVFRIAIANSRIESFENGTVVFRYRDNRSQQIQRVTLPAEQFIERFLLHVLPRGFTKVRHYGFLASAAKQKLAAIQAVLSVPSSDASPESEPGEAISPAEPPRCPHCRIGHLVLIETLPRSRAPP
jgi:rhodanese-related sulfurtransferase